MSKDSSAKYYWDYKERLQKYQRYQSLFEEGEEKKQQYGCEIYKNLPENEKKKENYGWV